MKLVTTALACLLLATMWPQDVDSKSMIVSSSNCCYTFVEKKISQKRVQCYRNTSSSCPYHAGIIVELKGGQKICALNTARWIKNVLKGIKTCP
ncbi:C-C Motif Chemokine 1 [Manis pentadactyla]|nr:C-C Motif Chemokine 1 [Manis pentadactyla]